MLHPTANDCLPGCPLCPAALQEAAPALSFQVHLQSGHQLQARLYLCYDQEPGQPAAPTGGHRGAAGWGDVDSPRSCSTETSAEVGNERTW